MALGEQGNPVRVFIVNPPIQDPWRTQGDYLDDQRRARYLIIVAVVSVVVSAFSGAAATVGTVAALRSPGPKTVKVECATPPPAGAPSSSSRR